MQVLPEGNTVRVILSGRLDAVSVAGIWDEAVGSVSPGNSVVADCSALDYLDGAGVALLLKMRNLARSRSGGGLELEGLRDQLQQVVNMVWDSDPASWHSFRGERRGLAVMLGHYAEDIWLTMRSMISFVGESISIIGQCLRTPCAIRWRDFWLSLISVGVDSLSIIMLIGFLMGLIMSFQSAVSLQRFGAEIFVPNMLGLVMFREMGPLVTSILLAARSGSAFAAEIGTMKVNEEVDALVTMGLSPMRFLVVPKVLSSLVAVPLMTMFFNFASLVGGALVMLSMGYPLVTFTSRVFHNLSYIDFAGGLFKACVFSLLVSGVGCLRGLETRSGASAVGDSTTSAVVSGIILIAVADGVFALVFYYLGI